MIEFKDEKLQKTYDECKGALNDAANQKNAMSEDIKTFEKYLKNMKISSNFVFQICSEVSLSWDMNSKRLMAQCTDETGESLDRPLIEMKFKIREQLFPFLTTFLRKALANETDSFVSRAVSGMKE